MIDRKFKFVAVNPCNKKVYTEENAFIFCAKDAAVVPALKEYKRACKTLGSNPEHIESISLLIDRIIEYQLDVENRVPDTVGACEVDRCIGGIV